MPSMIYVKNVQIQENNSLTGVLCVRVEPSLFLAWEMPQQMKSMSASVGGGMQRGKQGWKRIIQKASATSDYKNEYYNFCRSKAIKVS